MTHSTRKVSFRISHDFNGCQDVFRRESVTRSYQIVSKFANHLEVDSFYPKSESELRNAISALPSDIQRILPHAKLGEEDPYITTEKVTRVLELWKKVHTLKPEFDKENPYPNAQVKLFAIHLHLWMTFEKFLRSDSEVLIYLEDDIFLPGDFKDETFRLTSILPSDWDFFNFVIPEEEIHRWKESLNLPDLDICVNFQRYPGACLMVSRKGARKLISHYLDEVENMPIDFNLSTAFDVALSNVRQLPEHDFAIWQLNQDPRTRKFKTFTYVPSGKRGVKWRNYHSTWR